MPDKLDLDLVTSYILRTGVILSIILIVTGIVLMFVRNGGMGYSLAYLSSFKHTLDSSGIPLSQIPHGLVTLDGIYYIALGLWVLIFTPITVVVMAIVDFAGEKNRLYVAMSIIVLFNLFFAMLVIPRLL